MEWKLISPSKKPGAKQFTPFEKWTCPSRNADGSYCKYNPPKAETPEEKFDENLAKSGASNDQYKKDASISRQAIVKSMIEAGYRLDTPDERFKALNTFKWWLEIVEGRYPLANAPKTEARPMTNADAVPPEAPIADEILLEDIPF